MQIIKINLQRKICFSKYLKKMYSPSKIFMSFPGIIIEKLCKFCQKAICFDQVILISLALMWTALDWNTQNSYTAQKQNWLATIHSTTKQLNGWCTVIVFLFSSSFYSTPLNCFWMIFLCILCHLIPSTRFNFMETGSFFIFNDSSLILHLCSCD